MTRGQNRSSEPALLSVERAGTEHVVSRMRRSGRLAPRVLRCRASVEAVLVPIQAGPVAGDRDWVRISVGESATLVVRAIAATLALPGQAATHIDIEANVARGGRLVLDEAPLIVAAGADVRRSTRLELAPDALAAVRDVVVLGRAGERGARIDSTLRASLDGDVLLHDSLRLGPRSGYEDLHVALGQDHRVIGTVGLLGARGQPGDDRRLELAGPGQLRRAAGPSLADVEAELSEPWASFVRHTTTPRCGPRSGPPSQDHGSNNEEDA